jgi:hypothetical protein
MSGDQPIFVHHISRSGGTLTVTMLDAHPDVAMSYEIYPHLLERPNVSGDFIRHVIGLLEDGKKLKRIADMIGERDFGYFLRCVPRSGLKARDFLSILREHLDQGMTFDTPGERLRLIERCAVRKMKAVGKTRWGVKASGRYDEYLALWPHAHFVNITRDGRDVLASTLNTGNFNKDAKQVGQGWANSIAGFDKLLARQDVSAYRIIYEELAQNPEKVARELCLALDLEYTPEMLRFHEMDLTIHHTRHISGPRISKPVDTTQIGRWRKDLNEEQLSQFYAAAREKMIELKYLPADDGQNSETS